MGINRYQTSLVVPKTGTQQVVTIPPSDQPTSNQTIWLSSDGRTVTNVSWSLSIAGTVVATGSVVGAAAYTKIYNEPGISPAGTLNKTNPELTNQSYAQVLTLTNNDATADAVLLVIAYSDRGLGQ